MVVNGVRALVSCFQTLLGRCDVDIFRRLHKAANMRLQSVKLEEMDLETKH